MRKASENLWSKVLPTALYVYDTRGKSWTQDTRVACLGLEELQEEEGGHQIVELCCLFCCMDRLLCYFCCIKRN